MREDGVASSTTDGAAKDEYSYAAAEDSDLEEGVEGLLDMTAASYAE